MMEKAPREDWQYIIDKAKEVIMAAGECDLMNNDIRGANFIIAPVHDARKYRVTQIDFGRTYVRSDERRTHTDESWGIDKLIQDEPGAIGEVMKRRLKEEYGFELKHESLDGTMQRWGQWQEAARRKYLGDSYQGPLNETANDS